MSPEQLLTALAESGISKTRIAEVLGRGHPAGSRLMSGQRQLKAHEIAPLTKLLHDWRAEKKAIEQARRHAQAYVAEHPPLAPPPQSDQQPVLEDDNRYVGIRMLPMFGGMGGGGMGEVLRDDDLELRLAPVALIQDMLRGRPDDFIWIRVRGDSMEPDFQHDDELICDLRDTSPMQPGPFALYHEDGYYVKNVERTTDGRVRIFSSNPKYTAVEEATEHTRIIGRPVWFGRRL